MQANNKTPLFRILILISKTKLTEKAMNLFQKEKISLHLQFAAHGTANSDMMDILGLSGIEKDVLVAIMPKKFADEMLVKISKELELRRKNSGIAFTMPLSGISGLFLKLNEQIQSGYEQNEAGEEKKNMSESKYSLIAASVNQGFSEEVMNAAREAGAKGGTVFHTNCIANKEAMNLGGLKFQEEKETVLIIAENETKLNIMQSISQNCGMHTKAQGMILSMPIDNIMGLHQD